MQGVGTLGDLTFIITLVLLYIVLVYRAISSGERKFVRNLRILYGKGVLED